MNREADTSLAILVVEDVAETRDGIEKLLKVDRYQVALARDDLEAIEIARRKRPDLILVSLSGLASDVIVIAHRIRERSGGLARVQALGLYLDDIQRAQVSMNLLDHTVTPLWLVWETVRGLAADEGVELRESELIGLAPLAALLEVADHVGVAPRGPVERRLNAAAEALAIRDFEPTMALELRLAAATQLTAGG